jgi:hypothetical protein
MRRSSIETNYLVEVTNTKFSRQNEVITRQTLNEENHRVQPGEIGEQPKSHAYLTKNVSENNLNLKLKRTENEYLNLGT